MKIGILFKTEVGLIDPNYTAGTERMFLQDISIFEEKKIDYLAFSAAKIINSDFWKARIKRLFYPRKLIILSRQVQGILSSKKLTSKLLRLYNLIAYGLNLIGEASYACLFAFRAMLCDVWYVYQVGWVVIIRPKKTILALHNPYELPLYKLFRGRYVQAQYLCCSAYLKKRFVAKYPKLKSQTHVLYNSINSNVFYPHNQSSSKSFSFLYLSAWIPEKGMDLFLDTINEIENKGLRGVKFLIAGSIDLWYLDIPRQKKRQVKNSYLQKINYLRTAEAIGGISYSDLPKVINRADCVILPSIRQEPFPLINLEALSCGKPVIAFDVGGNGEIIFSGKTGFLLSEKKPDSLTKVIQKVINQPQQVKKMTPQCLSTAANFSQERRWKELLSYFKSRC